MTDSYIGRFAPSPTGPLHLGSLLTALASFLDARANNGIWRVRMEDLDPPREMAGAADDILRTLEQHGLLWDGEVLYQSQRHSLYEDAVQQLLQKNQAFYCTCSRKQLQDLGANAYPGTCRGQSLMPIQEHAVRVQVEDRFITFDDALQGACQFNLQHDGGDVIIKRKDGLYAYHLAVVIDDAAQNITHIVRGSDLLDSTPRHLHLQQLLNLPTPHYAHLPVIVNEQGQKLSKQTFAAPLPKTDPVPALFRCLQALGQQPPSALRQTGHNELLRWSIDHWSLAKVPRGMTLLES
ncbi:MAG TPA: tRNA glutamyl-Q(34) synthetase GluQRS, partial [Dongiaceae bacterium]|nr:tRNA glutamyl-Q(34) synthetase GluQRS [Dongiaceae bacterium]